MLAGARFHHRLKKRIVAAALGGGLSRRLRRLCGLHACLSVLIARGEAWDERAGKLVPGLKYVCVCVCAVARLVCCRTLAWPVAF